MKNENELINLSREELNTAVIEKLDNIKRLFSNKNDQYATKEDCLSNFTLGAKLLGHEGNYTGRYEALKAYVAKHIAQVYDNKLTGPKVDESLQDIATYSIIALVMLDEQNKLEKAEVRNK